MGRMGKAMSADQNRKAMRPIFRAVAASYGLSEADLYVRDKRKHVAAARREAWEGCRRLGFTYQAIADLAGWDCSTVQQALNKRPRPS